MPRLWTRQARHPFCHALHREITGGDADNSLKRGLLHESVKCSLLRLGVPSGIHQTSPQYIWPGAAVLIKKSDLMRLRSPPFYPRGGAPGHEAPARRYSAGFAQFPRIASRQQRVKILWSRELMEGHLGCEVHPAPSCRLQSIEKTCGASLASTVHKHHAHFASSHRDVLGGVVPKVLPRRIGRRPANLPVPQLFLPGPMQKTVTSR